jgi:hypothetical protein
MMVADGNECPLAVGIVVVGIVERAARAGDEFDRQVPAPGVVSMGTRSMVNDS